MAIPTVKNILLFHKIDRGVYDKLVFCGADPGAACKAVALFMWIEKLGIGIIDPIKKMTNYDMIDQLINEADAVLHCILLSDGVKYHDTEIPLITSMTGNSSLDINFFNLNKDLMMRNLVYILDGVGSILFDDKLYDLLRAYEAQEEAAAEKPEAVRPELPPELAVLYDISAPVYATSNKNDRSMFIGFTVGLPIDRLEIMAYFTQRWGDCIDEVFITERTEAMVTMGYGKIVFKSPTFIFLALKGDQVVIYAINGKPLAACKIVFDDHLLRSYEIDMAAARTRLSAVKPSVPQRLAASYDPTAAVPSIEDARSMFITFSKGFPIRRDEIMEHFTERWGDCIDRVMMERTVPGGTPMYGRIVFKSNTYISLVLNGERVVKYNINGRQLWARKYVRRVTVN